MTCGAPVGLDGPGICRLEQRVGTITSSSVLGRKQGPSNTFIGRDVTITRRSNSSVYHSTVPSYSRLSSSSAVISHDQKPLPERDMAAPGNTSSMVLTTWLSY